MIEEVGAELAAAANDDEPVDGSRSPNQSPRRARDSSGIDTLEPSVETHVTQHQHTGLGS